MELGKDYIQITNGEIQIFPSGSVSSSNYQSATGVPQRYTITTHVPTATDGFLATNAIPGSWLTFATPSGNRFNIAFASSSITSSAFPLNHQGYHGWYTASLNSGSLTANNIASAIHTAISTKTIDRAGRSLRPLFSASLASNVVTLDIPVTGSSRVYQDSILSSSFGVVVATTVQGTGDVRGVGYEGTPDPDQPAPFTLKVDPDDPTSFMISGSGGSMLYMSGSGKIGIGTKNPTNDFEVAGSGKSVFTVLRVTGTTQAIGPITASGHISSSGNLYGSRVITDRIQPTDNTSDIYFAKGIHVANGSITASADISSSGEITGYVGYNQHSTSSFTVGRGDVVRFGSGTSVTGKIYHYKSDGSWELANCTGVATSDGMLAVALGTDPDQDGMLLRGMCKVHTIQGTEAVGMPLYLSETATGTVDCVAPAASDEVVRVIGYCLHASSKLIWFNPDSTFVEIA